MNDDFFITIFTKVNFFFRCGGGGIGVGGSSSRS